jgi:multidrug resistance efflux pump
LTEDVAQPWLALHCQSLGGACQGLVVQCVPGKGAFQPIARWPKASSEPSDLTGVARQALVEGRLVTRAGDAAPGSTNAFSEVALPFGVGSRFGGAVAVRLEHPPNAAEPLRQRAEKRLRAGAPWLEALLRGASSKKRLVAALEIVALTLEQDRLGPAATAVANEIASRLGCERVAVGVSRRGQMQLEALSNTAKFDARAELVRDLEAAMDEAADQDAPVSHPPLPGGTPRIVMAHERLVRSHGAGVAWTVPLGSAGRATGAMTFERSEPGPPDLAAIELCEDLGALLGPIFELKRKARESWLERTWGLLRTLATRLRGPGHAQLKLATVGCGMALMLLLLAQGEYRITAEATLEGRVQRAIVAGVDGFIAEANVRAGDLLEQGQIMGRLDDRDLLLERRNWSGKLAQLGKEHRAALAEHDRSQVNFLSAKIDQARAELALLEAQLQRTLLVAPFDGIVVKGDLSQSLGSPVERGELLFEVAPLDGYRVILEVDQSDIAEPAPGQKGWLALSALPGQTLPLTVERITPVSVAEDGRNFFRVEAHLDEAVPGLRPGMEGVAKIEVDQRRFIWIWTHSLTDWLRLATWSWLP